MIRSSMVLAWVTAPVVLSVLDASAQNIGQGSSDVRPTPRSTPIA